jgi:predicted HD phosphohydrolase
VRSLELQGGPFTFAQSARFMAMRHAADAVQLRRWDEQAKTRGAKTASLDEWLEIASTVLLAAPAATGR